MKQILLLAALGLFIFSCDQDDHCDGPVEAKCEEHSITDAVGIRTMIVGSWRMTELLCYCCPGVQAGKPDKEVTAVFRSDGTYFVIVEDEIISHGDWELVETAMGYEFSFGSQEMVPYLDGVISMCATEFVADLTPLDGCRHTFTRTD